MSILTRIISWMMVFATVISALCVPVSASSTTDPAPTDSKGDFYDWVVDYENRTGGSFGGRDPDHHGGGRYSKDDYADFVSELPATGLNSAGRLIWRPSIDDLDAARSYFQFYVSTDSEIVFYCSSIPGPVGGISASANSDSSGYLLSFSRLGRDFLLAAFSFHVPIAGSYGLLDSHLCDFRVLDSMGELTSGSLKNSSKSFVHLSANGTLSFSSRSIIAPFSTSISSSVSVYFPVYEVIPDTAVDISAGSQYNVTTRPTAITGGNYGIVGDNGTINTVTTNNQIINETNNTYYNPATGQTSTITDWSYDYSDRSYTLTMEGGDTYTVTYGDENIVIQEGDTVYNIYYMVDKPAEDPDPSHTHTWAETSRTDPTCTAPGKIVYTCSECGQTKTETLPALGHDWKVVRTVPTEYDEDGNQTQEGYTLYECQRCGEQYKDADSTGPPGDPGNDGGLGSFLDDLASSLLDGLSSVVELLLSSFRVIPTLFSGFLEFLSAMFPYLPDEVISLFTFGMAAVVLVGIIKAIRR